MGRRLGPELLALASEVLPTVVVAIVVFQVLRSTVLERYVVPTSSMAPTLHGGGVVHGDRVLVSKLPFTPERWDLVVVRNPDDAAANHLVKRVAALGGRDGVCLQIAGGDLFEQDDSGAWRRVRKHPIEHRDLRIPVQRWPGEPAHRLLVGGAGDAPAWRVAGDTLELYPAGDDLAALAACLRGPGLPPRGHLGTSRPVDLSFLDHRGERHQQHRGFDQDVGLAVSIELQPGFAGIQLVHEHHGQPLRFTIAPDGTVAVHAAGGIAGRGRLPPPPIGRPWRVAFGHLDGRSFVVTDEGAPGAAAFLHPIELGELPAGPRIDDRPRLENALAVGVAGAPALVRGVEAFRDLYYRAEGGPFAHASNPTRVPPGHYFLLGDNTFDSQDSRRQGSFAAGDLVGLPIAVLGPAGRRRWLIR